MASTKKFVIKVMMSSGPGDWGTRESRTHPPPPSHRTHKPPTSPPPPPREQPYKQHAQMDRARAQGVWQELRGAVDEIFAKNASNLSFEHLYRSVKGVFACKGRVWSCL